MGSFCENCGTKNDPSAKFCENCGRPLLFNQPPSVNPPVRRTWTSKIASVGAFIAVVFFFLPWVSVSCSSNAISMPSTSISGYHIASGKYPFLDNLNNLGNYFGNYGSGINPSAIPTIQQGNPAVWIILVFGILGLLSLFVGGRNGGAIALIFGVLGIISLLVFQVKLNEINSQITLLGYMIKTEIGLYAEWIGFLSMTSLGALSLKFDDH